MAQPGSDGQWRPPGTGPLPPVDPFATPGRPAAPPPGGPTFTPPPGAGPAVPGAPPPVAPPGGTSVPFAGAVPTDPQSGAAGPGGPPRRRRRLWPKVLAGIGAVVLVAGVLVGSYVLVSGAQPDMPPPVARHSTAPTGRHPTPSPTRSPVDIGSRRTDPKPLTVDEVFGDTRLRPDPGRDAVYRVLATDLVAPHCGKATTGEAGAVLDAQDCTQVVRATLRAPTDGYVLTAGVCNLADAHGARAAGKAITALGRKQKGGFAGMAASGPAARLDASPTLFALRPYGHYLLYAVVARANGAAPSAGTASRQIMTDIVQTYLTGVIDHRAPA